MEIYKRVVAHFKGATIVVITHQLEFISIFSRFFVISFGQVIKSDVTTSLD